ncbi:MAG: 30S ribosomal protein S7 [Candidatus Woesearchaeota archaeon]
MEIKAFNRWNTAGIEVKDEGLKRYISLEPTIVPRMGTAAYVGNKFHKSKVFIVQRLMNKLFIPGHKSKKHFKTSYHCTGKSLTAYKIVENALKIIEQKTKKNPIEVLVRAIENGAPREEIIMIEYGGAHYPKAVEVSPQRRIDFVLRMFVQGAYQKSFNNKKSIVQTLSEEILNAYYLNQQSLAISKKHEMERQADASR